MVFPYHLLAQVEWDQSSDFTSGEDGGPSGQASADATQMLCSGCVNSFFLGNLTLSVNGTADFFGRLNAGNRILVSQAMSLTYTEVSTLAPRNNVPFLKWMAQVFVVFGSNSALRTAVTRGTCFCLGTFPQPTQGAMPKMLHVGSRPLTYGEMPPIDSSSKDMLIPMYLLTSSYNISNIAM